MVGRKDEEMFRLLFVEGNAYYKQQLADLLGMRDHHFKKYMKEFQKEMQTWAPDYFVKTKRRTGTGVYHRLKYDAYTANRNILVGFYRMNHYSDKTLERKAQILRTIADEPMTLKEIVEFLEGDEFTKRTSYLRSLETLMELGVVKKEDERYAFDHALFEDLTDEEVMDVYSFVHVAANTHVLSVPGFMLLDFLKEYVMYRDSSRRLDLFFYRFVHHARVLNEYKCFTILSAIHNRKELFFRYYSKKHRQKFHTSTDEANKPKVTKVIPLFLIYEHQYGRWYLVGKHELYDGFSTYKLEGMSEIESGEQVDDSLYDHLHKEAYSHYEKSWFVSTDQEVMIRLKFHFYMTEETTVNFIEQRVLCERPGGRVVHTAEPHTFEYHLAVNGLKEIKPWILSFGSSVEVLEPVSLREEIMNEWLRIEEEYLDV